MSKSLVICCDGTWNRPDQLSGNVKTATHVSRIALGLARENAEGQPQVLFYQRGVGTSGGQLQRVRGLISGSGTSRNVRDCYRFIVENYEPEDKLYFFGFSRGAYTARSTVGLIRNAGILRHDHADRIGEAYRLYRSRSKTAEPRAIESSIFRRMYSHENIEIHFIGVWDTVGSLGIPIDGLPIPEFISRHWGFHDTDLSSRVRHAYHALAIDERREPFQATLWQQKESDREQTLEQVWFAGVHTDVGGGNPRPGLAEIPLLWMVQRARDCDLTFEPEHFHVSATAPSDEERLTGAKLAPDPLGEIIDSRTSFFRLFPSHVRKLDNRDGQSVATSAVRRLRDRSDYRPETLKRWVAARWPETKVHDGS